MTGLRLLYTGLAGYTAGTGDWTGLAVLAGIVALGELGAHAERVRRRRAADSWRRYFKA